MKQWWLAPLLSLALIGCARESVFPRAEALGGIVDADGVLQDRVCRGVDLRPEARTLDEIALVDFLGRRGIPVEVSHARSDLAYVDIPSGSGGARVRLRVARLASSTEAAEELHHALDEHGRGAWGVHRGNLAVLATAGDRERVVSFAARTGLACWGVLTVEGGDGAFVVPGGYAEL